MNFNISEYKSLVGIKLSGLFKLRKIMLAGIPLTALKAFEFPNVVPHENHFLQLKYIRSNLPSAGNRAKHSPSKKQTLELDSTDSESWKKAMSDMSMISSINGDFREAYIFSTQAMEIVGVSHSSQTVRCHIYAQISLSENNSQSLEIIEQSLELISMNRANACDGDLANYFQLEFDVLVLESKFKNELAFKKIQICIDGMYVLLHDGPKILWTECANQIISTLEDQIQGHSGIQYEIKDAFRFVACIDLKCNDSMQELQYRCLLTKALLACHFHTNPDMHLKNSEENIIEKFLGTMDSDGHPLETLFDMNTINLGLYSSKISDTTSLFPTQRSFFSGYENYLKWRSSIDGNLILIRKTKPKKMLRVELYRYFKHVPSSFLRIPT